MYELIIYVDALTYVHRNIIEQVCAHNACMSVRTYSQVRFIVLVVFSCTFLLYRLLQYAIQFIENDSQCVLGMRNGRELKQNI
jgi:hypothetical protein